GGRPAQSDPINRCKLFGRIGAGLTMYALREILGKLLDHAAIHQVERLRSDRGVATLDAVGVHLRIVEGFQMRRKLLPRLPHVNEPTPAACSANGSHEPIGT